MKQIGPKIGQCIYCGKEAIRKKGDHIVPNQFGSFRGELLFKGLCRTCDSKIGKSEQIGYQSSPVPLIIRDMKPRVIGTRAKRSFPRVGAQLHVETTTGAVPLKFVQGEALPVRQNAARFTDQNQEPKQVIMHGDNLDYFLTRVKEALETGWQLTGCNLDDRFLAEFLKFVRSRFPNARIEVTQMLPGITQEQMCLEGKLSPKYW